MLKMYCYKKCSTCKKAENFLQMHHIESEFIDYTIQPISFADLSTYYQMSGLAIDKFFNTSGLVYRELQLKQRLAQMDITEKLQLLSDNPMLVKRPFLVGKDFVLLGFKEKEWQEKLL